MGPLRTSKIVTRRSLNRLEAVKVVVEKGVKFKEKKTELKK